MQDPSPPPRYNVAPSQPVPVIISTPGGGREIVEMTWGLLPSWAKDPRSARRPINARAETLSQRPSFRSPLKHRRCLVPASGFFEWKKTNSSRIPYYIHRKDGDHFAFAGLYDIWTAPGSPSQLSFTIVTTEPNELVSGYHDRMPAILLERNEERWILPGEIPLHSLSEMFTPYPADMLVAYQVSRAVNNPENEGKKLIQKQEGLTSIL